MGKEFGVGDDTIRLEEGLSIRSYAKLLHPFLDYARNSHGVIIVASHNQDFVLQGGLLSLSVGLAAATVWEGIKKRRTGLTLIRGHADAIFRKSAPIFFQPADESQDRPDLPIIVLSPLEVLVEQVAALVFV